MDWVRASLRSKPGPAAVRLMSAFAVGVVVIPLTAAVVFGLVRQSWLAAIVVLLIAMGVLVVALVLALLVTGTTEGLKVVGDAARRRHQDSV